MSKAIIAVVNKLPRFDRETLGIVLIVDCHVVVVHKTIPGPRDNRNIMLSLIRECQ